MKIKQIVIFFFLLIFNFLLHAQEFLKVSCRIGKIDSIGNYYVIYATDSANKTYMIVSKKDTIVPCQNVVINKSYQFTFDIPVPFTMNVDVPITYPDGTKIPQDCVSDAHYHALELRGLCYDTLNRREEMLLRQNNKNLKTTNRNKGVQRMHNIPQKLDQQ